VLYQFPEIIRSNIFLKWMDQLTLIFWANQSEIRIMGPKLAQQMF